MSRNGPDGGADIAQPDVRHVSERIVNRQSSVTTTTTQSTTTTTATERTTTTVPNCETIIPTIACAQVDCVLIVADLLTIDGVTCYGCPR